MKITKVQLKNKKTGAVVVLDESDKSKILTQGDRFEVDVFTDDQHGQINLFDVSNKISVLGYDAEAPFDDKLEVVIPGPEVKPFVLLTEYRHAKQTWDKKYFSFRVKSRDADPTPTPVPDKPPIPVPPVVTPVKGFEFGIVGITAQNYPYLADLKPRNNRLWVSPNQFKGFSFPTDKIEKALDLWERHGVKPIITVSDEMILISQLGGAPAWFVAFCRELVRRIDLRPKLKGQSVDVAVWNEPDHTYFEKSNVRAYAEQLLVPVYKAIKNAFAERIQVGGGNLSWNVTKFLENQNAIIDNSDWTGFHGYMKSMSQLAGYQKIADPVHAAGKLFKSDEWGLGYGQNVKAELKEGNISEAERLTKAWENDISPALVRVSKYFDSISYFIAEGIGSTNSGQALLKRNGTKFERTSFFDQVKKALLELGLV